MFNPNLNSKPEKPPTVKRSKFLTLESQTPSYFGEIPIKGKIIFTKKLKTEIPNLTF